MPRLEQVKPADALDAIYDRIRADPFWDHLRLPGIRLVPGVGSYRPSVMIVGEAPGATENTRGRPFCGASGKVLHQLMEVAGLRAELAPDGPAGRGANNAFITNVVKYRPPGNRKPNGEEIAHGRLVLRSEWACLGAPRVLVAAGSTAMAALAPALRGRERAPVGQPFQISDGTTVWPMYHPAYPLRQRSLRPKVEAHWEELGRWLAEQ